VSAEFWNKLKHLQSQYQALQEAHDALAERVLALEAEPTAGVEIDLDTLEPKPKRGRPRKNPE